MIDTINNSAISAKIRALYVAYNALESDSKPKSSDYTTIFPWRYYDDIDTTDRVAGVKQAMTEIADEIITLEGFLRDPVQDAEMRAEINASIAINGNWDDCAENYLHTPMQERLYRESIEASWRLDYDSDHGYVDTYGSCPYCKTFCDFEENVYVAGFSTCYNGCFEEVKAFAYLLGFITNTPVEESYWGEISYGV